MTPKPDDWIPITEISGELRRLTGEPGPGWRSLVTGAADGRLSPPIEKRGGRWGATRRQIPEVAEALGLSAYKNAEPT